MYKTKSTFRKLKKNCLLHFTGGFARVNVNVVNLKGIFLSLGNITFDCMKIIPCALLCIPDKVYAIFHDDWLSRTLVIRI